MKIKLEITEKELTAIVNAIDTLSTMVGVGEESDVEFLKIVKTTDKMLNRNGYKRKNN